MTTTSHLTQSYLRNESAKEEGKHNGAQKSTDESLPRLVRRQAQERCLDELATKEFSAEKCKTVVANHHRNGEQEPKQTLLTRTIESVSIA